MNKMKMQAEFFLGGLFGLLPKCLPCLTNGNDSNSRPDSARNAASSWSTTRLSMSAHVHALAAASLEAELSGSKAG